MTVGALPELVEPGRGRGLLDVAGNRFLLRLIVRKELCARGGLLAGGRKVEHGPVVVAADRLVAAR